MRLNNRLEEAYRIGQKLAFAKFADPADPAATDTLLSNPLGLSSLRAHGYDHPDLDSFASPIEAEMQQIEGQYEGEERQRRLEDLAERVYGNFAALPDGEIEALAQGRENLEHDLATGANRHDNTALQSPFTVRPLPYDPSGDEYTEPPQVTHVPVLHNPRRGEDYSYTANVPTDNEQRIGYSGGHAHDHYSGFPLFEDAPTHIQRSPMVMPLEQGNFPGTPDFVNSNKDEYDARVAEGHNPHPGGMVGDQVQLGSYPRPLGQDGRPVTTERVEDPFTYAHEMYHHKINNIGRSHPTLGRLQKYLRPGDNEMYADYYAAQAPRASDTDARFHSFLDTTQQFAAEKSPQYHDPKHPLQITSPGSPPTHFKPSVRMALPRVGPMTGP